MAVYEEDPNGVQIDITFRFTPTAAQRLKKMLTGKDQIPLRISFNSWTGDITNIPIMEIEGAVCDDWVIEEKDLFE